MLTSKMQKLYVAYLLLLVIASYSVYTVATQNTIQVLDEPKEEKAKEYGEANVNFVLEGSVSERIRLTTAETVNDLLKEVRKKNPNFLYTKTAFLDGVRIVSVNKLEGNWEIYRTLGESKVKIQDIESENLINEYTYTLKIN